MDWHDLLLVLLERINIWYLVKNRWSYIRLTSSSSLVLANELTCSLSSYSPGTFRMTAYELNGASYTDDLVRTIDNSRIEEREHTTCRSGWNEDRERDRERERERERESARAASVLSHETHLITRSNWWMTAVSDIYNGVRIIVTNISGTEIRVTLCYKHLTIRELVA